MRKTEKSISGVKNKGWKHKSRGYVQEQVYLGPVSEAAFAPFATQRKLIFFDGKNVLESRTTFPVFTVAEASKLLNIRCRTFYRYLGYCTLPRPLWRVRLPYRFAGVYTSNELVIIARTYLVLKHNSAYITKRNVANRVELDLMFSAVSKQRDLLKKEASWNV